jgi:outer membrane protein assembly factor BamA
MTKVKHCFSAILFLTLLGVWANAQSYSIKFSVSASDSAQLEKLLLTSTFTSRIDAGSYIATLQPLLQSKGFITASLDSIRMDTSEAFVFLYLGEQYKWSLIRTQPSDAPLLETIRFPALKGVMNFSTLTIWQQKILDYLEDNGHPFGKAYLDSIAITDGEVSGLLVIEKGALYKIDSLQIIGNAKVNPEFLQKYLEFPPYTLYNKGKLQAISKKISELAYIEEEKAADVTMLPTGAVLNLYIKAKRSSQVNALVGFLPNSDASTGNSKLLLTVDANILLKNALGSGETIGLVWQQLQKSSPRLNLLYEQPFIFHSPFGLAFSLDMYKQDSVFLNINMNLGTNYRLGERQTGSVFLQRRQSIVSGINAASIIQTKQLPQEADVSSINLGVGYDYVATDYRFNPRKGNLLNLVTSAGTKKIKKNNLILELKDPSNPSFKFDRLYDTVKLSAYQFRIITTGAHFIPFGKQNTLKLALNAGIYQSVSFFRNELFRIGGNSLLRGFDEESQFVSQYSIGTAEYRLLTGRNSAFFAFVDGGWGKHPLEKMQTHTYVGTGLGLSFETKAGLINLTLAVGKRNDTDFNLRRSKIHIGFVSYF